MASGKQRKEEVSNAAYAPFVYIQHSQINTNHQLRTLDKQTITLCLLNIYNLIFDLYFLFLYLAFASLKNKIPRTTCSTIVFHQ